MDLDILRQFRKKKRVSDSQKIACSQLSGQNYAPFIQNQFSSFLISKDFWPENWEVHCTSIHKPTPFLQRSFNQQDVRYKFSPDVGKLGCWGGALARYGGGRCREYGGGGGDALGAGDVRPSWLMEPIWSENSVMECNVRTVLIEDITHQPAK